MMVEFLSYVDDIHCGLYDSRRVMRRQSEVERRERMEVLLERVSVVLKEVARDISKKSLSDLPA